MRHDMQKMRTRVTETEKRISVEDAITPLTAEAHATQQQMAHHSAKLTDMEDLLWQNKLRFISFPEGVEGKVPESFMETGFRSVMPSDSLLPLFAIERAHRVPFRPLPSGMPPRPILLKRLHYFNKGAILWSARSLGDITYNDNSISIFPDFKWPSKSKEQCLRPSNVCWGKKVFHTACCIPQIFVWLLMAKSSSLPLLWKLPTGLAMWSDFIDLCVVSLYRSSFLRRMSGKCGSQFIMSTVPEKSIHRCCCRTTCIFFGFSF